MKSDRLNWVVAVPFGVMPARPWEKVQAGPSARPPPGIGNRRNDFFMPIKMEFKGWVTDYKQCGYQGHTDTEVANVITDLQEMLRDQYQKNIDGDQNQERARNLADNSLFSVCGSRMRPIYRRWSECWTTSKKNSGRCPVRYMDEKSHPGWR